MLSSQGKSVKQPLLPENAESNGSVEEALVPSASVVAIVSSKLRGKEPSDSTKLDLYQQTGGSRKNDSIMNIQSLREEPSSSSQKGSSQGSDIARKFTPPENWANAPEFVPKFFKLSPSDQPTPVNNTERSYASVVSSTIIQPSDTTEQSVEEMCPYAMVGECRYGDQCLLLHGNMCDLCGQNCLHPFDPVQREKHTKECIQQHEQNMELSFAIARSSDKSCGICMEVVMEKSPPGEQRFGILPSCNHCYCLSCLRKWRQARQFENKICRSCPECRVTSDFICPSRFWVEGKDEKEKLITSYKAALSKKPCRYYKNGSGECPFGNKCFYLHALPNGTKVDVGPPRRKPKRIQMDGQEVAAGPASSIWDFLYDWELQWLDVEDFMDIFSSDFEDESEEEDELHDFPSFFL